MKKSLLIVFAVLALAVTAQAELLGNPGFEDGVWDPWGWGGSGSGSGPDGWAWIGATGTVINDGTAQSGDYYSRTDMTAQIGHVENWGWGWHGMWQFDWPAYSGMEYTISGWFRGANINVLLEPKDSSGDYVDINGDGVGDKNDRPGFTGTANTDGSWTYFEVTDIMPDVAEGWTEPITNWGVFLGGGKATAVDWDDWSVVPEPATIALLGLGGLLLRRRRRA